MNIEHLRTFLEIAATGNFNRAAERLHVTQSTVSARIRALEDSLDRRLFVRGRNGVTLTGAGRHLERYAAAAVRAWLQGKQEVALPAGFRTAFGLGISFTLWERLVPRWMPRMRGLAPDVALRVMVDFSAGLNTYLAEGTIDVGVMYLPRHGPGMAVEKLLEERLVLVSTTARGLTAAWMSDYVLVDWGVDFREEHSRAFPAMEAPAITVGLGDVGLRYILEHGGSGYFTLRMVQALVEAGRLHRVEGAPEFRRATYAAYPVAPRDPEVLALALDELRVIAATETDV